MHPVVASRRDELEALCHRLGIRRLELFGSAARDDFDESRSDIDLLVDFGEAKGNGLADYFDFKEALEALFHRNVDLVEVGTVRNPYIRASMDRDRKLLYGP